MSGSEQSGAVSEKTQAPTKKYFKTGNSPYHSKTNKQTNKQTTTKKTKKNNNNNNNKQNNGPMCLTNNDLWLSNTIT